MLTWQGKDAFVANYRRLHKGRAPEGYDDCPALETDDEWYIQMFFTLSHGRQRDPSGAPVGIPLAEIESAIRLFRIPCRKEHFVSLMQSMDSAYIQQRRVQQQQQQRQSSPSRGAR